MQTAATNALYDAYKTAFKGTVGDETALTQDKWELEATFVAKAR